MEMVYYICSFCFIYTLNRDKHRYRNKSSLPIQIPMGNPSDNHVMNADLVMSGQRQHRDLFTGSVGLPNVGTHVGSVVHAFETMALGRQVEETRPQSRLMPGPIKLSGGELNSPQPPPKPEKKFYKFPARRENTSPVRKITLATDPKLENQNPMSSGLIRFDQDISPNHSDYDSTLDYRKHFEQDTLVVGRNENESNEDNDHLLRGTMVSRSFIKNVRRPRKVADAGGPMEMTSKRKTKSYVKSQMVPQQQLQHPLSEHIKPPTTYVSNSAISQTTTTIFKPKSTDRAVL